MSKSCIRCNRLLPLDDFHRDATRRGGKHPYCRECVSAYSKAYALQHRAEAKARANTWYAENAERAASHRSRPEVKEAKRAYMKAYRRANALKLRKQAVEYDRTRSQTDLSYKLTINLRKRLSVAIRDGQKAGSAIRDLGCSIEELKRHLEAQFQSGMTWKNWGRRGWHIDHVKPLASFDLTDTLQCREALHYTNLQPLWASDNLRKGGR